MRRMHIDISKLEFHAPCSIIDGLSQLKNRVKNCFVPSIIMRQLPSGEVLDSLDAYLERGDVREVGFNIGYCLPERRDLEKKLIDTIASIRDKFPGIVTSEIDIKFGVDVNVRTHLSPLDSRSYLEVYRENVEHVRQLLAHSVRRGLGFNIENDPSPSFAFSPAGSGITPDPYPRWGGAQSAVPALAGSFFSYSGNMIPILIDLQGVDLQLDLEHLGQTVQWGNIFNLDTYGERPRVGDLVSAHQDALRNYGFNFDGEERLFDYSQLSDEENQLLEKFGYVVREGQPIVYRRRLTLENELSRLQEDSVRISSITPGFQVYQSYFDTINSTNTLVMGSHLPGITPKYFRDPAVRNEWERKIKSIHALCLGFMEAKGIRKVEIEPVLDDGKKLVYEGHAWDEQINTARTQLIDNFSEVQRGEKEYETPFYLK